MRVLCKCANKSAVRFRILVKAPRNNTVMRNSHCNCTASAFRGQAARFLADS